MIKIIAVFTLILIPSSIIFNQTDALQQIAGKIQLLMKPGETSTFEWGLNSDREEESIINITTTGNASKFISYPKNITLKPNEFNFIKFNVTIPDNFPLGNITSTLSATETTSNGSISLNVRLSKDVVISIEK